MTPCLFAQAMAGVDQQHRDVGGTRGRYHVARVLGVPRRIANDKFARRRGEVSVSNIDRDALLALGQQAVRQQRQIDRFHAPAPRSRLDRRQLIRQQSLAVVEQTADQGALAIVHAARGDESEQPGPRCVSAGCHQK